MNFSNNKLIIFSWAMYDFANTIFSMNIISLYFALWVTVDKGGEDILYSIAISCSVLLAAISAPVLGAISDKIQKKMPFLIIFTIVSCIATAAITLMHQLWLGLILFMVANYCYQLGDMFYNSLLPQVSNGKNVGKISGYGTSLGYLGTIVGLLLVAPFVLKYGRVGAFAPTGFFFLLFSLPCFIFVKDNSTGRIEITDSVFISAFLKLKTTLLDVKKYSELFKFLITAFLALNAINTAYIFMSIYIKNVGGFAGTEIIIFYSISSIFAIIGSFFIGYVTDAIGAKKTFKYVLILWSIVMILAIFAFQRWLFWIIGPLAGISLGGTWTSARSLVVKLSPASMSGEIFGFYGLVGKTAIIIGPMIWGLVVLGFGSLGLAKYRIAIFMLLLFLLLALFLLRKVSAEENT